MWYFRQFNGKNKAIPYGLLTALRSSNFNSYLNYRQKLRKTVRIWFYLTLNEEIYHTLFMVYFSIIPKVECESWQETRKRSNENNKQIKMETWKTGQNKLSKYNKYKSSTAQKSLD